MRAFTRLLGAQSSILSRSIALGSLSPRGRPEFLLSAIPCLRLAARWVGTTSLNGFWGKLGMWVFLAGDAMSFGGLLAGYGAIRASSPDWPDPLSVLGINLTAFMTFLLIVSSFTMARRFPPQKMDIFLASGNTCY